MNTIRKILPPALTVFLLWILGYLLFVGAVTIGTPAAPDEKTDAIIVLTGGDQRIEEGLRLFADGLAPELFITGVYPGVHKNEILRKWNGEKPLPECCITLGYQATTTFQNAREAEEWVQEKQYKTIRLVTADFHMSRALIEFRQKIPGIKILPHPMRQPDATPDKPWFWIICFSEYNKTLVRLAGIILSPGKAVQKPAPHGSHT